MVLLKLGNLHQNAKRYDVRNTEREAQSSHMTEREARDENVRAKRADFLYNIFLWFNVKLRLITIPQISIF